LFATRAFEREGWTLRLQDKDRGNLPRRKGVFLLLATKRKWYSFFTKRGPLCSRYTGIPIGKNFLKEGEKEV